MAYFGLPNAVNATEPLFQAVWVPGQVIVDHPARRKWRLRTPARLRKWRWHGTSASLRLGCRNNEPEPDRLNEVIAQ
jgi:hypothetical protein